MAGVINQNKVALWAQANGKFTSMGLLGLDSTGLDEVTEPGSDKTPVIGVDRFGRLTFRPNSAIRSAPGDFPTASMTIYQQDQIAFIQKKFKVQDSFALQRRYNGCLPLDNPSGWTWLQHLKDVDITQLTTAAGPSLPAVGDIMTKGASLKAEKVIELVKGDLTNQTSGDANDILGIYMIPDLSGCPGYVGADKICFAVCAAGSGVTANVLASVNTGGTWAILGADPFAADENVGSVIAFLLNETQIRVIVGRLTTDGSNPAEIAYADQTVGAETASPTWNAVNVGSTNGDVVTALGLMFIERLYAGAGGDIFVSEDKGESWGTAIYTGSNAINQFALSPVDNSVWAVGASNLILQEKNKSGTFDTKVGPSGGGAMGAVAVADDGTVFVGNGTSIFKSSNGALNTGGWTNLKSFGADHAVKAIKCIGGDSQLLYVVVDDVTPDDGELWISVDGGATFEQITELTNTGYNAATFSEVDDNLILIAADDGGIVKYAP